MLATAWLAPVLFSKKVSSLAAQFNLFGSSMGVPGLLQFQRMSKKILS
jgi:hypothetical protein